MINTNDMLSSSSLDTFVSSAEELGKQQKTLEDGRLSKQNAISFSTKTDAALTDNVFG